VMFACNQPADRDEKDTLNNVRRTGEFVANLATYALREEMNGSSATVPHGVDEFELVGLAKGTSQCVKPPRVAASPVAMECRLLRVVDFEPEAAAMHIDDAYLDEAGRFNMLKARPLARLGGFTYLAVGDVFEMGRPKAAAG
jgi:flavin reductase (DIM6/NTAB) family NADH-FMN oxidoreductase RutF